jgi:hypothetical protein
MSAAAQEVLLSHVNKDVKLTTFLGRIQLPINFSAVLFRHLKKAIALTTERRYGKDLVGFLGSPFSFQRTQTIQQLASSTQKCLIAGLLPTSAASLNQISLDSRAPFDTAERYGTSKRLSSTMAADGTRGSNHVRFSPELAFAGPSFRTIKPRLLSCGTKEPIDVRVGEEIFGCCQAPLIRLLPQVLRVSQPIRVMSEEKTASRHNSTSIYAQNPSETMARYRTRATFVCQHQSRPSPRSYPGREVPLVGQLIESIGACRCHWEQRHDEDL